MFQLLCGHRQVPPCNAQTSVHCTGLWYLSIGLKFLDFVSVWVTVNLKLKLKLKLELLHCCYCSDLQCDDTFVVVIRYVFYMLDGGGQ
jgi:hypothetical protein